MQALKASSYRTLTFICTARVIPGSAPTRTAFPFKYFLREKKRTKYKNYKRLINYSKFYFN